MSVSTQAQPNIALTKKDNCLVDDFNGGFMHVIHQLYMGIQKHLEHTLASHKQISFSQFLILVGFSCGDSTSLTQARLAEYLTLTEATISRHITTLVKLGLLKKVKADDNKRSYKLTLTKDGVVAFKSAKTIITHELDTLFSHITQNDRAVIVKNFTATTQLLQQRK